MQATGSSIEQHDAQKSSSRRGGGSSSLSSAEAPGGSGSATSGAERDNASFGSAALLHQSPSHTPPGASGSRHERRRDRIAADKSLPKNENSVTLVRVNALRDDVRELKKIESAYDGDGEYEDNPDDSEFPDDDAEVPERYGDRFREDKRIHPSLPLRVVSAGTQSDSDAAAIAMLTMKDSASGISSDGGDSTVKNCRTRSAKRKACAPLDMKGKRKMSVTAILN